MENDQKPGNFWVGFFLGGFFGLLLLILWGTEEGKKIAKLLAEKGEILEGDIEKKLKDLEKKGEELISRKPQILPTEKPLTEVKKSSPLDQPRQKRKFFRKQGKKLSVNG